MVWRRILPFIGLCVLETLDKVRVLRPWIRIYGLETNLALYRTVCA